MTDLLAALGLVLALEGALYALAPQGMQDMMRRLIATSSDTLRVAGLLALALGVGLVWLARAQ